eukprot:468555-Pleurochrysis_carterae.AAC.1
MFHAEQHHCVPDMCRANALLILLSYHPSRAESCWRLGLSGNAHEGDCLAGLVETRAVAVSICSCSDLGAHANLSIKAILLEEVAGATREFMRQKFRSTRIETSMSFQKNVSP